MVDPPRIAIIGSGFGGLCTAACDTPAFSYCLSFEQETDGSGTTTRCWWRTRRVDLRLYHQAPHPAGPPRSESGRTA